MVAHVGCICNQMERQKKSSVVRGPEVRYYMKVDDPVGMDLGNILFPPFHPPPRLVSPNSLLHPSCRLAYWWGRPKEHSSFALPS